MLEAGQGFPRSVRLLEPRQFKRVFDRPTKFYQQSLGLSVKANELGFARLGVTITRRNIRHAVDRNRIRRMIRESFRMHIGSLGNLDIVVQARRGSEKCEKAVLLKELLDLWQRVENFQLKQQNLLSTSIVTPLAHS